MGVLKLLLKSKYMLIVLLHLSTISVFGLINIDGAKEKSAWQILILP